MSSFIIFLLIISTSRSHSKATGISLCPLREADSGLFSSAAAAMVKFCSHHRVAVRKLNPFECFILRIYFLKIHESILDMGNFILLLLCLNTV